MDIGTETFIIGVVGELQFDVLQFRMKSEYGLDLFIERLPWRVARWVVKKDDGIALSSPDDLSLGSACLPVHDAQGKLVLLFESEWAGSWISDRNPSIALKNIND